MKSHVSLEQKQCPICGKVHDTGNLLLDTRIVNGEHVLYTGKKGATAK